MIKMNGPFMVLDVESAGLMGDHFSFGYVVIDRDGTELESDFGAINRDDAYGPNADELAWVDENVPVLAANCTSMRNLRTKFWDAWVKWKAKGAYLLADCPFPVETRFINSCIANDYTREDNMPYPIIDVASVLFAAGMNPIANYARKDNELPAHNPLNDARQSGRLFIHALNVIEKKKAVEKEEVDIEGKVLTKSFKNVKVDKPKTKKVKANV